MNLYQLPARKFQSLFGAPDAPTPKDVTIIAQRPDGSAFLILSAVAFPELGTALTEIPAGYDFTYCQQWGLTLDNATLHRIVSDLRSKHYPPIHDYVDGIVKGDAVQQANYISACAAVKTRFPKIKGFLS